TFPPRPPSRTALSPPFLFRVFLFPHLLLHLLLLLFPSPPTPPPSPPVQRAQRVHADALPVLGVHDRHGVAHADALAYDCDGAAVIGSHFYFIRGQRAWVCWWWEEPVEGAERVNAAGFGVGVFDDVF